MLNDSIMLSPPDDLPLKIHIHLLVPAVQNECVSSS
jgi:hypothetical protein